jgi:hypothetical protein
MRFVALARLAAVLAGLVVAAGAAPGRGHAAEKWGPFRGQFVDQDTGRGIPGAAVIAIWWKNEPNPIQMNRSFFDAIEAVSDADGRFEIPRYPKPPFFDFLIFPAEITYFAPGYLPVQKRMEPPEGQPFVSPTVVLMRRFDLRNPTDNLVVGIRGRPDGVPLRKLKEFTHAVNRERVMRGLQPYPVPGVDFIPKMDE